MTNTKGKITLLICLVLSLVMILVLSSCGDVETPSNDSTNTGETNINNGTSSSTDVESDSNSDTSIDSGTDSSSDTSTDSSTGKPVHTHTEEIIPAVTPTCTEAGWTKGKKCSLCGEILEEQAVVNALGHAEEKLPSKEPTCTETGLTEGEKCAICDEILVEQDVIQALRHDKISHEAKEPTCLKIGWDEYQTCSRCDYTTYKEIEALEHSYANHEAQAVTCTEIGWEAYQTCSRCDYTTYKEIAPLGHSYTREGDNYSVEYVETLAPTCISKGRETAECTDCGNKDDTYGRDVNATGVHKYTIAGTTVSPTCTEKGYTTYACSDDKNCTYTENRDLVDALDHSYANHVAQAATCTEIGWDAYQTCSRCDYTTYKEIKALGHSYINHEQQAATCTEIGWEEYQTCSRCDYTTYKEIKALGHNEITIDAVEPTCTKSGLTEGKKCTACGEILVVQENIPESGHSYGKFVTTKEPTCTEQGEKTKTCFCGDTVTEEISANGHTEEIIAGKTPTCTETGLTNGKKCTVCKEVLIAQQIVNIVDHSYKNYICTSCGYTLQTSKGLEFALNSDKNSYSVTGIGSCADADLIIPNMYKDLPVTAIGSSAFSACYSLTSVTIGDSVTLIGNEAFSACTALTSVTIGNGVTSIGEDAFYYCTSLAEINFNAIEMNDLSEYNDAFYNAGTDGEGIKVTIGKNVTKIPDNLFYWKYSQKIISVEFEEGSVCESIGNFAFYNCSLLTSIKIPNSVTSIGEYAFSDCTSLTSVTIPDSVTSIGSSAFSDCDSLTSITIPDSVTSIGASAFSYCDSLTSAIIPANIISSFSGLQKVVISSGTIIEDAFYGYYSLTSVTIGEGVTSIGDNAFCNSPLLTEINYNAIAANTLGKKAFYGVGSDGDGIKVTIGKNVVEIPSYLFYTESYASLPSKIKSVVFEEGSACKSIGEYAFYNCTSLTSVHISDIASWCNISFANESTNPLGSGTKLYLNGKLVTNLVIPSEVTEIKDYAFYGCTWLTSITIPDSVTIIGDYAFYDCTWLTSVDYLGTIEQWCNIPFDASYANPLYNGAKLYLNGKLVTKLVIPDTVTEINVGAFESCTSLTSITIPDSVTSIGSYAFYCCTSLTSITIGDSVTSIGNSAFSNCTSLTEINFNATAMNDLSNKNYVFYNAGQNGDGITVNIGKNVTKIPAYLFYPYDSTYSPKITSVVFEEGSVCESIGSNAFYCCTSLTSITIPDSVTSIGSYAFESCTSLTSITIGNSVTCIGESAFESCDSLTSVHISDIASWCNISFANAYTNPLGSKTKLYLNGKLVTNLVIPSEVTEIKDYTFCYCDSLTSITIPDSVTSIGERAFSGCESLVNITVDVNNWLFKSIDGNLYSRNGKTLIQYAIGKKASSFEIPNSVTSIGEYAFSDCDSLTSITIPNSVTSIGNGAFSCCYYLSNVTFKSETGWYVTKTEGATSGTSVTVTNSSTADYLVFDYCYYYWYRK